MKKPLNGSQAGAGTLIEFPNTSEKVVHVVGSGDVVRIHLEFTNLGKFPVEAEVHWNGEKTKVVVLPLAPTVYEFVVDSFDDQDPRQVLPSLNVGVTAGKANVLGLQGWTEVQ